MSYIYNPLYGTGVFRRRIALRNQPGLVLAELEDCFHAFRVRLAHDGACVTKIESDTMRYPRTICAGAADVLQRFVGDPLSADQRVIRQRQIPGEHCTHLYDLAWLAMAQALRGDAERIYDVEVPDARDDRTEAIVRRDGEEILRWQLEGTIVTGPAAIAGNALNENFGRWASAAYAGDTLEAAYVLQIGCFVAGTRRLDINAMGGRKTGHGRIKVGTCYAHQAERRKLGVSTEGMARDFTDTPEQLLQFL
jgi:hypothetical protein